MSPRERIRTCSDACPDCLRPAGARHPHARECPRNETARRRRGVDWSRTALYSEAVEHLGEGARDRLLRELILATRADNLSACRQHLGRAIELLLTGEYLEALRSNLEDEAPGRVSENP